MINYRKMDEIAEPKKEKMEKASKKDNESKITNAEKEDKEIEENKEGGDKSKNKIDSSMFSSCIILNNDDFIKSQNEDSDSDFNVDIEFEDFTDNSGYKVEEDFLKNKFDEIQ